MPRGLAGQCWDGASASLAGLSSSGPSLSSVVPSADVPAADEEPDPLPEYTEYEPAYTAEGVYTSPTEYSEDELDTPSAGVAGDAAWAGADGVTEDSPGVEAVVVVKVVVYSNEVDGDDEEGAVSEDLYSYGAAGSSAPSVASRPLSRS